MTKPECVINSDCHRGAYCENGHCHLDCRKDFDCKVGRCDVITCSRIPGPDMPPPFGPGVPT